MENPFVSIVAIGYNNEDYIEYCINSLLNQDYNNYEVVFINDGSTDRTSEIVHAMESRNSRLSAFDKENGGIVSARIKGVKEARGSYITFVDGDDWVDKSFLSSLVNGLIMDDNSLADIVASDIFFQNIDGSLSAVKNRPRKEFLRNKEYFYAIMTDKLAHFMCAKLFKKDLLIRSNYLYFPRISMAEDLLSNAVFGLRNPKVHIIDSCNYFYRYNSNSFTKAGDMRLTEQIKTLLYLEKILKRYGKFERYENLMAFQWLSFALTYLPQKNVHYEAKKRIAFCCGAKAKSWKNNKYAIRKLYWTKERDRRIFTLYMEFPYFSKYITKFRSLLGHIMCLYNHIFSDN